MHRVESDYTTVPTEANECQSPETGGGVSSVWHRLASVGIGWHRLASVGADL